MRRHHWHFTAGQLCGLHTLGKLGFGICGHRLALLGSLLQVLATIVRALGDWLYLRWDNSTNDNTAMDCVRTGSAITLVWANEVALYRLLARASLLAVKHPATSKTKLSATAAPAVGAFCFSHSKLCLLFVAKHLSFRQYSMPP